MALASIAGPAAAQMTMPTTGTLPSGSIDHSLILGDDLADFRSQWANPLNVVQQGWVNQINAVANGSPANTPPATFSDAANMASIAEAAGLRYAMTGAASDLTKVVTALLNADVPAPTGSLAGNSFIIRPEVLTSYLSAYDYVRGASTVDLSATTRAQIETQLVSLTNSLDNGNGTYSNARGKIGATRALAGLILQNQPLLDTGLSDLSGHFAYSTTNDGWFTDGPAHYLNYTLRHLTLFTRAYQQGNGIDLWPQVDPYVRMTIGLRLPDGSTPNVSDGLVLRTATSLFSQTSEPLVAASALWNLEAGLPPNYDGYSGTNVLNNVNSPASFFALTNFAHTAVAPAISPTFLATGESKIAVFRTDWSTTSDYLLLSPGVDSPPVVDLPVNGQQLTVPAFHSANDTGEILVAAKGQYILVAPGYNRTDLSNSPPGLNTAAADQHNVILVDGSVGTIGGWNAGPYQGQLMRPTDFLQTNRLDSTEFGSFKGVSDFSSLEMSYGGATVRRNIAFPGENYFVVADRMLADASHTYGFNLIGRGTQTVLASAPDRIDVQWESNGAQVIEHLVSNAAMTLATSTHWMHATFNHFEQTHGMLAQVTADNSLFLSIIEPGSAGGSSSLDITRVSTPADALALQIHHLVDGWTDAVLTQIGHADQTAGDLATDANYAYLRSQAGSWTGLQIAEGTYLDRAGEHLFVATHRLTMSLAPGDHVLLGTISADGLVPGTELRLFLSESITGAWLDGTAISFTNGPQYESVILPSGGSLRVEFAAVPEAGTLLLVGATAAIVVLSRRRRPKTIAD